MTAGDLRTALGAGLMVVLIAAPGAPAAADDPWVAPDKGIHFGVSAGLAIGGWALGIPLFDESPPRFVLGATVAVTAAIGKELYDWTGRGTPSWRDFSWSLLGAGVGLLLAWAFDVLWVDEPAPSEPAGTSVVLLRFGGG